MANMHEKRSAFEDQWRDAFEDAEITPSAGLWKNIDNTLTAQENGKYRKGFIFYRSLAAACVVCLLALGYYALQVSLDRQSETIGQDNRQEQTSEQPENLAQQQMDTANEATGAAADTQGQKSDQPLAMQSSGQEGNKGDTAERQALPTQKQESIVASGNTAVEGRESSSSHMAYQPSEAAAAGNFAQTARTAYDHPSYLSALPPAMEAEKEADWIKEIDRLYRVPQVIVKEDEASAATTLFAGINLATNYFDPNFTQGNMPSFSSALSPLAANSDYISESSRTASVNSGLENRPQLSVTYGVDFGLMLSKHLSLESGIDYGRLNSTTNTSWIAEDFGQGERIPLLVSNARNLGQYSNRTQFTTSQQELTNSFEILSVPLKIGYNLRFNRINLNLSSGFAANFFLNNRLSDETGQLETVNLSANSVSSPYRPLYYSAVVSGGVNYLITENYALSVAPTYNFALSDLTESGYNFSSQPNNFGIDFGIRYNFR
jgi:hypothetical protein